MKWYLNSYIVLIILIVCSVVDLLVGTINVFDKNVDWNTLLLEIRVPKTLTAISAGGMLSLSGLVLQMLFRNPLAGPYVLGISSAASLFTAIGIMSAGALSFTWLYQIQISVLSVIGGMIGMLLILMVLRISSNNTVVLIIGLMLSQLYGAIMSVLSYLSSAQALKVYTIWTMGNIQNTDLLQALFLFLLGVVALVVIIRFTKFFMIYITGEVEAQVMGLSVKRNKKILIVIVGVIVGLITAFCGPIAFVGMCIPIVVRILHNSANIRLWMLHSFMYGSVSVVITDIINQVIFNGSVPLNVLISLWGVPLIIWILIHHWRMMERGM
ncbi:MAG: iron ABC transporter [Bacteroidia bacterium]|nr:MAG: iron ABC transporter [Bacteroidia bacterium]